MLRIKLIAAVICLLGLQACSSSLPQPVVDYKTDYDFAALESVSLLPYRTQKRSSLLLSDMTYGRIDTALLHALSGKGISTGKPAADADLVLSWFLVEQEQTAVRAYDSNSYYHCWRCGPAVSDVSITRYTEGTLIVDLIDLNNNQSVWRGVMQQRVPANPEIEHQQERLDALARQMFRDFPPDQLPDQKR